LQDNAEASSEFSDADEGYEAAPNAGRPFFSDMVLYFSQALVAPFTPQPGGFGKLPCARFVPPLLQRIDQPLRHFASQRE
jgi:hypothetical protein